MPVSRVHSSAVAHRLGVGLVALATAAAGCVLLGAQPAGATVAPVHVSVGHGAQHRWLPLTRERAARQAAKTARTAGLGGSAGSVQSARSIPNATMATPRPGDALTVASADGTSITWHDVTARTTGTYDAATAGFDLVYDPVISADGSEIAFAYQIYPSDPSVFDSGLAVFSTTGSSVATKITDTQNVSSASTEIDDDEATFAPGGSTIAFARITTAFASNGSSSYTSVIDSLPVTATSTPTLVQSDADDPTYDAAGNLDFTPELVEEGKTAATTATPLVEQIVAGSSAATTLVTYADALAHLPDSQHTLPGDVGAPDIRASRFSSVLGAAFLSQNDPDGTGMAPTQSYSEVGTIAAANSIRMLPTTLLTGSLVTASNGTDVVPVQSQVDLDSTGTQVTFDRGTLDLNNVLGTVQNASTHTVDVGSGIHEAVLFGQTADGTSTYLPASPAPLGAAFVPLATPFRVLDTRKGIGALKAPIGPGGYVDVQVSGAGLPVAGTATAVVLNLTGIAHTSSTYLQAYPTPTGSTAAPLVSNLNLGKGQTVANAVTVALSGTGKIRIANALGSTDALADVTGFYTPDTTATGAALFTPLSTPTRVLDTRQPVGVAAKTPLGPNGYLDIAVATGPVVPADATSVVLSLGGVQHAAATFLTAYPTPSAPGNTAPTTSTVNLSGATRANLATVTVGANGEIRVYNAAGSTDVYADVVGYYRPVATSTGSLFHPVDPLRIYDTRYGEQTVAGAVTKIGASARTEALTGGRITTPAGTTVIPAAATAVQANVTAVDDPSTTFVSLFATPTGGGASSAPAFSSVNAPGGQTTATSVISVVGYEEQTRLYNAAGSTDALLDLAGYFAPYPG